MTLKYRALATDYDGTLAHDGAVSTTTLKALERFRASGRKLILVTGRELPELKQVFPQLDLFEFVVAENGALLHCPRDSRTRLLCAPASQELAQRLRELKVSPLSVGEAVIATIEPNDPIVLEEIKRLNLELQIIFNKGSVMVLPSGVNKATGLEQVLKEMQLSRAHLVGVGDAENDHAFLEKCAVGVAVSNALPALKERADFVTRGARGDGVTELIDLILNDQLASFAGDKSQD